MRIIVDAEKTAGWQVRFEEPSTSLIENVNCGTKMTKDVCQKIEKQLGEKIALELFKIDEFFDKPSSVRTLIGLIDTLNGALH